MLDSTLEKKIITVMDADRIVSVQKIQSLWSGYGQILRITLVGGLQESIVVKHVQLPEEVIHPRGWSTDLSHKRKIRSYEVESAFYTDYSGICRPYSPLPQCFCLESHQGELLMILEDLNTSGYPRRVTSPETREIKGCLKWLARFHGVFMGTPPQNLWTTGTYWHLETRPEELEVLDDLPLKEAAAAIDSALKDSPFQTLVHGDAKLANFCFSPGGDRIAAVDYQYVGGGCGMKDVAYFMGSCLYEQECEEREEELLNHYFSCLLKILKELNKADIFDALEKNWRALYPYAWTDFHRFLKGWSPGHWKINSYSERLSRLVVHRLNQESRS